MRNLVVCCDGTWNTPDMVDQNGTPIPTNVVKIKNAIIDAQGVADQPDQLVYYHPGVGTGDGFWNKFLGGTIGQGLAQNVKSAYFWLAKHYLPGDHIYIFGFSRGAYTARAVAGVVAACGLLNLQQRAQSETDAWKLVDQLFARYYDPNLPNTLPGALFFDSTSNEGHGETPIWFVGVWDTVGSLGIPPMSVFSWFNRLSKNQFKDTTLNPKVKHARHAMGLDEMRANFLPTFWQPPTPPDPTVSLKQLWFPGSHGDVGGGYTETTLSDGALLWMIEEARDCGLQFDQDVVAQLKPNPLGTVHNAVVDIYKRLPTQPRAIPWLDAAKLNIEFHSSVVTRMATRSLTQGAYRPGRKLAAGESVTYRIFAKDEWNRPGLFLEHGVTYDMAAEGEWIDGGIKFDPAGRPQNVSIGRFFQLLVSPLGKLERLLQKLTGNPQINLVLTRRADEYPWFALIGCIINGVYGQATGVRLDETFMIGTRCQVTPKADGYLCCFANDAWNFYGNNRGSVHVTVTRLV